MKTIILDGKEIIPSKVVCIGRNYVEHIYELGNEIPENMVLFNKTNSSINNKFYFISHDTRFEAEICFLIKNNKIEAIGFGLDLTKADIQNKLKQKGLPWERAKSFHNSAVFSKFISFNGDIENLRLELFVNGKLVQFGNYELMIYKPNEMIKEILTFMDLNDGDIIMSGTPKGVSTYNIGDEFIGKIYDGKKLLIEEKWKVLKD